MSHRNLGQARIRYGLKRQIALMVFVRYWPLVTQSGHRLKIDMINLTQKENVSDRYYHHVSSEARSVLGRNH